MAADTPAEKEAPKIFDVEITDEMTTEQVEEAKMNFEESRDRLLKKIDENIARHSDPEKKKAWKRFRVRLEQDWREAAQSATGNRQYKILAAYEKLNVFSRAADQREFQEEYGIPENEADVEELVSDYEEELDKHPSYNRTLQMMGEIRILEEYGKSLRIGDELQQRLQKIQTTNFMHFIWQGDIRDAMRNRFKETGTSEEQIEAFLKRGEGSRFRETK